MNTSAAICVAGILTGGMVGAAALIAPAAPPASAPVEGSDWTARMQAHESRVRELEQTAATAQREASDARAVALGLDARLRKVEDANRDLRAQIASGLAAPGAGLAGLTPEEVAAGAALLAAGGEGAHASLAADEGSVAPEARAVVEHVLADIRAREEYEREVRREQERAEREQRRQAQRVEMFERRIEILTESLGLAPHQSDAVAALYTARDQQRAALMAEMRSDTGDRSTLRARFEAVETDTQARLQQLLTPEQWTTYEESQQQRRRTTRRGRGRDRSGDGNGNGNGGFGF